MARKFGQIISRGDRGWLIGGRGKRIPEVLWYRLHESGIGNSACVHRWSDMAVLGSAWVTLVLFRTRRRDECSRLKEGLRRRVRKSRQKEDDGAADAGLMQIGWSGRGV